MTKTPWQPNFAADFLTQLKYQPQIPKMLFYSKENKRANLPIDQIVQLNDDLHSNRFHVIDIASLIKQKQKTFEEVLSQDLDDKAIVTNNNYLTKAKMPYHVILLDASQDYFYHYYPEQAAKIPELEKEFPNKPKQTAVDALSVKVHRQIKMDQLLYQPVMYSLVFMNNDNSYFAALPCLLNDETDEKVYKNHDTERVPSFKHFKMPIRQTTLKTIAKILEPMPLTEVNQQKLLTLIPYKHDPNHINKHPTIEFKNVGFAYQKPHTAMPKNKAHTANNKTFSLQLGEKFYDTDSVRQNYYTAYKRDFLAAINENVTIRVPNANEFQITLAKAAPFWEHYAQKALTKFQTQSVLKKQDLHYALRININPHKNLTSLMTDWDKYFYSLLLQRMFCSWQFDLKDLIKGEPVKASHVTKIPVKNKPSLKPLAKGNGLQQFMTDILINSEHKYALQKDPTDNKHPYRLTTAYYQEEQNKLIMVERSLE